MLLYTYNQQLQSTRLQNTSFYNELHLKTLYKSMVSDNNVVMNVNLRW